MLLVVWTNRRMGIPRMHAAAAQEWILQVSRNGCSRLDALELSASVCILMRFLRTQYSSFANQMFAVFSAEFFRERERDKKILVTSCGCSQNGHARCLAGKNYIEVEGIISAFQCRHLFASRNGSTHYNMLWFIGLILPHNSGQCHHAMIVHGASLPRSLGSVAFSQLDYPRPSYDSREQPYAVE